MKILGDDDMGKGGIDVVNTETGEVNPNLMYSDEKYTTESSEESEDYNEDEMVEEIIIIRQYPTILFLKKELQES